MVCDSERKNVPRTKKTTRWGGFLILEKILSERLLSSYEREETHKSSALDGICEATLALCRDIGALFGQNTSVWIQELLQKLYILVVDMFDIILGKVTLFGHR